ncbi:DNA primase, partial [Escherichia coli]|nr:DNA primase [Escherichia coli]
MKLAPNVKLLPKDKGEDAVIFAGDDAYSHAEHYMQGGEARKRGDKIPPVYLGRRDLGNLENLRIVDDGRSRAIVRRAGKLDDKLALQIETLLAVAGVKEACFCDENGDLLEDWTPQLARLKDEYERGESLVLPLKKKITENQGDDELKPRVESRADGVFWVTPKVDKQSGEIIRPETWLCSPLELLGTGTIGKEHYRVMRWKKPANHEVITMAIPCGGIGDRDGWRLLKDHGLNVTTNGKYRAILADWMQLSGSHEEWQLSTTTGWHFGAYIMPDGSVIGESEKPILFTGKTAAVNGYSVTGTAEGWRDSVARLAGGNPSMMLGVAVSLSAPLIGLVGADGFGVHLFEQSSAGKTTTQNIASSLWGEPDAQRLTWYGTALGIANEAEAHNDGLLPLDEIGQAGNAREVSTSAYTLFNGSGKLQGAKDGGNREIKHWRTVAISTGEMDVETFLKTEGIKVKSGQLVRLLNVPMEKATQFHEYSTGKAHADALKDAWTENHGAAGREWVKWLADHQQEAKDTVRSCRERWRNLIPESYGEQVHRVGER